MNLHLLIGIGLLLLSLAVVFCCVGIWDTWQAAIELMGFLALIFTLTFLIVLGIYFIMSGLQPIHL